MSSCGHSLNDYQRWFDAQLCPLRNEFEKTNTIVQVERVVTTFLSFVLKIQSEQNAPVMASLTRNPKIDRASTDYESNDIKMAFPPLNIPRETYNLPLINWLDMKRPRVELTGIFWSEDEVTGEITHLRNEDYYGARDEDCRAVNDPKMDSTAWHNLIMSVKAASMFIFSCEKINVMRRRSNEDGIS